MKRFVLMVLLAMALPVAAFANGSVDFTNAGGTLSAGNDGLSVTGSTLVMVDGLGGLGMVTGNLGTVSFSTGALTSGSLSSGLAMFAAGGTFVITGNGTNGIPNTVLFTGTFDGPVKWEVIKSKGLLYYTISGSITGTWYNGDTVNGAITVLTVPVSKKNPFSGGTIGLSSGDTNISTVPEPGTLGLMGTGLIGLAGALRRKLKS